MIIAAAQMNIIWENYGANIKKIKAFVKEAATKKAELILFPEMSLSGFTNNIGVLTDNEEEIIKFIKGLALINKINIGIGYGVKGHHHKGDNKYSIISKDGNVLCTYTKMHPFSFSNEEKHFNKGNKISTCKINQFNITPFICYDLRFPEIFQIASKQSQIITVAASWPKLREEHWLTLLKARAIENQCFVIGINRCGEGNDILYNGASVFVSPDGRFINEVNSDEGLIITEIKPDKINEVKKKFDIKNDRREELYYKMYDN